jgi:hypothetical protein
MITSARASGAASNAERKYALCSNEASLSAGAGVTAWAFAGAPAGVTGFTLLFGLISIRLLLFPAGYPALSNRGNLPNAT